MFADVKLPVIDILASVILSTISVFMYIMSLVMNGFTSIMLSHWERQGSKTVPRVKDSVSPRPA